MARIVPFRGFRYATSAGPLRDLVAPPYDVIDETAQEYYYKRHPYNIIRLEYGKTYPTDNEAENRYTRAAADFMAWKKTGVLIRESLPALYLYEQKFTYDGHPKTRCGIICGVEIEPYEKGVVVPHEKTLPEHKADRLALMRACRANFSSIFGLYADEEKIVEQILVSHYNRPPTTSFTDENKVRQSIWVVTEAKTIARVQEVIAKKKIYIADGHHRYETALMFKQECREKKHSPKQKKPSDYIMMTLVNLLDPGLLILPTHRLVRNIHNLDKNQFLKALEENFFVKRFPFHPVGNSLHEFLKTLQAYKQDSQKAPCSEAGSIAPCSRHNRAFGLYLGGGKLYYLVQRKKSPFCSSDHSSAFLNLDVSVLHTLIFKNILGINAGVTDKGHIIYTKDEKEALKAVDKKDCQLAFFLNPTSAKEVIAVAAQGKKMPQKSTYFYPKLITGLVINPLT